MALGDLVRNQVLLRIANSGQTLEVHYPPARVPATGTAPGVTALSSPLTGNPEVPSMVAADPAPKRDAVTLDCLWLDGFGAGVGSDTRIAGVHVDSVGWEAGATALARVAVGDAAMTATEPYGDTVFTDASHVEYQGRRFRVLSVFPVAAGFTTAYTYYVWLKGAVKQ